MVAPTQLSTCELLRNSCEFPEYAGNYTKQRASRRFDATLVVRSSIHVSLSLESNEQQLAKYDYDSDDGGIVPESARPSKAVEVMYESGKS
jgi:hypothetical protein